jgi:hypothetical protein
MVELGDQGHGAVLEGVDHPHLPQGTGAVEWPAGDLAHELLEPGPAHRSLHPRLPDVGREVERRILDPQGVVDTGGRWQHSPP